MSEMCTNPNRKAECDYLGVRCSQTESVRTRGLMISGDLANTQVIVSSSEYIIMKDLTTVTVILPNRDFTLVFRFLSDFSLVSWTEGLTCH